MNVLNKLLFNLNTIAKISKGERISTAKEFIVKDEESILQPVLRWRAGDTRDKAVQVICKEVQTTIALSNFIMESKFLYLESELDNTDESCDIAVEVNKSITKRDERIKSLKHIRCGLIDANYGIDNICQTYEDDANVLAHLKPIIGEINDHISVLTSVLISLGESVDPQNMRRK